MITLLTEFRTKDEASSRWLANNLLAMTRSVSLEPGNIAYDLYSVAAEPNLYYVIETWQSAADAERHSLRVVEDGTVARAAHHLAAPLTTVALTHMVTSSS